MIREEREFVIGRVVGMKGGGWNRGDVVEEEGYDERWRKGGRCEGYEESKDDGIWGYFVMGLEGKGKEGVVFRV